MQGSILALESQNGEYWPNLSCLREFREGWTYIRGDPHFVPVFTSTKLILEGLNSPKICAHLGIQKAMKLEDMRGSPSKVPIMVGMISSL